MERALGATLKQARERKKLSLRDVERKTGIRNAHLSQIENGSIAKPDQAMLWDLAALYGVDYAQLLQLAGHPVGADSGRQRQRMSTALRAMSVLTPGEQRQALAFMAELRSKREVD